MRSDDEDNKSGSSMSQLRRIAAYTNASKSVLPWAHATGSRTAAFKHHSLSSHRQARAAEDFLVATRLVRRQVEAEASISGYFTEAASAMLSMASDDHENVSVSLPPPPKLTLPISEALKRRRTTRQYTGDSIRLDYMSSLLSAAFGVTGQMDVDLASGDSVTIRMHSAPSGGGLYPIKVLVAALSVKGLDRGVYRYVADRHALANVGDSDAVAALIGSFVGSEDILGISRSAAIFFLIAQPWKSMRKYGDRGMRLILLEAGAIAQNINLAAVGLGCGSADCASFCDDEVHSALGLDGLFQTLIHSVVVGIPAEYP